MNAYVVDASVAAKWFLSERETLLPEALRILEAFAHGQLTLSVPDLFWPEIANVMWKAVGVGRMSRGAAQQAIESLSELNLPTTPSKCLVADAFSIAATFDCTVYDSLYVALAVTSDALLITADERLANALAASLPVRWLGSLP